MGETVSTRGVASPVPSPRDLHGTPAARRQTRVFDDRLRLGWQVNLVIRQAPQHRRDARIHERKLVGQKVRFDLEQLGALQNGVAKNFLQLHRLFLVRLGLDLLHQAVPVALDPIQRQAELCPGDRVDRHQRGMRETLIEVLDDDARVVEHQVPIDQRRHAVIRIEIEEILRELRGVDTDDVDADAFLSQHDARAMTERVIRRREQRHDGSSARQLLAPANIPT